MDYLCNVQLVYMDNFWKALVIFHEFYSLNLRKIFSTGLGLAGVSRAVSMCKSKKAKYRIENFS